MFKRAYTTGKIVPLQGPRTVPAGYPHLPTEMTKQQRTELCHTANLGIKWKAIIKVAPSRVTPFRISPGATILTPESIWRKQILVLVVSLLSNRLGCSMEGALIFCRIRSFLSTCRKQGIWRDTLNSNNQIVFNS
jgi:hypothetical protein